MWHAMGESVKEIVKERNKYVGGENKNIPNHPSAIGASM